MNDIKPTAWARKWFIDGEIPKKEKNANNRWAWPEKFGFKELTKHHVFDDDVPLYTKDQLTNNKLKADKK